MNEPVVAYNTEAKRETIEEFGGEHGFRIRWRVRDHWADFEVFRKIGYEVYPDGSHGPDEFERAEGNGGMDCTTDLDEANTSISGYIKWDGCSQIEMDEHWCGPEYWKSHIALMEHLWRTAFELMGKPLPSQWACPLDNLK